MKFLCPNCKAKYRIGPEKLQGRQVAKIRCRKCGVRIHIARKAGSDDFEISTGPPSTKGSSSDGETRRRKAAVRKAAGAAKPTGVDSAGSSAAPIPGLPGIRGKKATDSRERRAPAPRVEPSGTKRALAAPPVQTQPGNSNAAPVAGAAKPAPHTTQEPAHASSPVNPPSTKQPRLSSAPDSSVPVPSAEFRAAADPGDEAVEGWFVGVNGVPLGPIPVGDLGELAAAGHIDKRSLVWRDGFSEWRPLGKFSHLVRLLGEGSIGGTDSRPSDLAPKSDGSSRPSIPVPAIPDIVAGAPLVEASPPVPEPAPQSVAKSEPSPWEDEEDDEGDDQPTTIRGRTSPPSAAPAAPPTRGSNPPAPSLRIPPPAPVPSLTGSFSPSQPPVSVPPVAAAPTASVIEELNALGGGRQRKASGWIWVGVVVAVVLVVAGAYKIGASQSAPTPAPGLSPEKKVSAKKAAEVSASERLSNPSSKPSGVGLGALAGASARKAEPSRPVNTTRKSQSSVKKKRGARATTSATKSPASAKKSKRLLSGFGAPVTSGPSSAKSSRLKAKRKSGLDAASIERTVRKNVGAVKRSCWERGLRASGTPSSARVVVALEIAKNGKVKSAKAKSPKGFAALGRCIESRVRKWRFRRSSSSTSVNVPFLFMDQ